MHWLGFFGTTFSILAYLPQIVHLIRERCSAGLSFRAYVMWVIAAALLLSYAIAMRDAVFITLQSYNLAAGTLVCFYCKKYAGSFCEVHGGEPQ